MKSSQCPQFRLIYLRLVLLLFFCHSTEAAFSQTRITRFDTCDAMRIPLVGGKHLPFVGIYPILTWKPGQYELNSELSLVAFDFGINLNLEFDDPESQFGFGIMIKGARNLVQIRHQKFHHFWGGKVSPFFRMTYGCYDQSKNSVSVILAPIVGFVPKVLILDQGNMSHQNGRIEYGFGVGFGKAYASHTKSGVQRTTYTHLLFDLVTAKQPSQASLSRIGLSMIFSTHKPKF